MVHLPIGQSQHLVTVARVEGQPLWWPSGEIKNVFRWLEFQIIIALTIPEAGARIIRLGESFIKKEFASSLQNTY